MNARPTDSAPGSAESDRWLVIDGRRWRRTDPSLPDEIVAALTSHLGRGRSGVRVAKREEDAEAIATARRRVDLAKHGLGERGAYWWDMAEDERLGRAREALRQLEALG
jgi:hypothetical protein